MAKSKANRVKIIGRNDGQFSLRILSSNGKVLAQSDTVYARRSAAVTAAKKLVETPLELDED